MPVFIDSLAGIGRVALLCLFAYAAVVVMIRISGKRTLAKLNAFDFIVTVALGSTLASTILSKSTPLIEGLAAFATLIALQWLVAYASVRSRAIDRLVRSESTLLMHRGEVLHAALRRERVTEGELMTVIRTSPANTPENVEAVILETDGAFSVITRDGPGDRTPYTTQSVANV
ncbi:uncharacterized membrane protein YcaP (DUF421 family) [Palleronia aestuarii]|uniref:Uncharacterized membrane protein YcaP (DUF421 family) n=1 Tax=Palleronia aestuarii TaxID=568105 RepID=A0A2W7N6H9_9RHOB|nr:YetF domain-containing protein [Palleronia aestuarii]PZX16025.1 uncharacterized membrane protein YcaP (DUF421 family) [Palleronia aestuarii]